MPLLGICRGSQALNVACGGTLHQHLPGHRQAEPGTLTTHEVEILAGTRLAGLRRRRHDGRQLLPPPGGRPPRRRPARRRPRAPTARSRRSRARRVRDRRPVARRDARRRPAVRGAGSASAPRCASPPELGVAARFDQSCAILGAWPGARHPPARRRQALRRDHGRRRPRPRRARGHVRRPARPQRRGQVDHDEDAHRAGDRRRGRDRGARLHAARASRRPRAPRWASCRSSTTSTRR